ncbi:uncharacterized protein MONBRDRAFT_23165 [Monosiga brevicollis MX1]|uniref:Uncharacterized protein n=1 Tax=Monosiga brevicollis TaxID=81824 RepID=A9URD5_MONBE|nr:uncharacterized protein MONBRDRAFT_23165 [Monosiga brevicollis MX1]EDQ91903.1 predicted protein [Monosiga brevicollis MX1]|eukprot:XP_001743189.1 hypothetical protein [Monosiga brevicollis MX1]
MTRAEQAHVLTGMWMLVSLLLSFDHAHACFIHSDSDQEDADQVLSHAVLLTTNNLPPDPVAMSAMVMEHLRHQLPLRSLSMLLGTVRLQVEALQPVLEPAHALPGECASDYKAGATRRSKGRLPECFVGHGSDALHKGNWTLFAIERCRFVDVSVMFGQPWLLLPTSDVNLNFEDMDEQHHLFCALAAQLDREDEYLILASQHDDRAPRALYVLAGVVDDGMHQLLLKAVAGQELVLSSAHAGASVQDLAFTATHRVDDALARLRVRKIFNPLLHPLNLTAQIQVAAMRQTDRGLSSKRPVSATISATAATPAAGSSKRAVRGSRSARKTRLELISESPAE